MALDPSIILSGRQPDMVGQFSRGLAAGQLQNQVGRENALAALYASQGPQIAAGDQGALNALAGLSPDAALGVQQTRLGMDATRQNMATQQATMARLTREEQRALEDRAAAMTAAERAAAAAQIEDAVRMGMMVQSPEQWDAMMQQEGAGDLVGQFGNREAIAAKYMSMAEVLKASKPEGQGFRIASPEEAARYNATAGQFGPDGRFYPNNPPSGMSVEVGADGQTRIVQGPGAGTAGKTFTEGQSKDNVYATRARGALAKLDPIASELTSRSGQLLEAVPLGIGRELQGDAYQVAKNAGDEFISAILRKDTGAAITEGEQALYGKTYLPQPGDGDAVLAAKAEARSRALNAMEAGMSAAQLEVVAKADAATIRAVSGQGSQSQPVADQGAGDLPDDLTPAEKAALGIE